MYEMHVRLAIEAHPTMEADSARNPFSAALPSQMNSASTMSCVTRKGGSFWVGALASSAGSRRKSWLIKTNTFR